MIKSAIQRQNGIMVESARFVMRPLREADVTPIYLTWFQDEASKKYIVTASQMSDLEKLKAYIRQKSAKDDVLFLGIFTRDGHHHVGNIKYEPIDLKLSYAVMGILVGPEWRGKKVSLEAIEASSLWLRDNCGIKNIVLGVDPQHSLAIRGYEKVGFKLKKFEHYSPHNPADLTMVWDLPKQEKKL